MQSGEANFGLDTDHDYFFLNDQLVLHLSCSILLWSKFCFNLFISTAVQMHILKLYEQSSEKGRSSSVKLSIFCK